MPTYNDLLYYQEPSQPSAANLFKTTKQFFLKHRDTHHRKTLLFADWTAELWDSDTFHHNVSTLKQLLEDGFTIYIWQDDCIEKLSLDKINQALENGLNDTTIEYLNLGKVSPTTPVFLANLLEKECGIPQNQLCILDDYLLANVKNTQLPPRGFDLAKTECQQRNDAFDSLKHAQPPISDIHCSAVYISKRGYDWQGDYHYITIPLEGIKAELPLATLCPAFEKAYSADCQELTNPDFLNYLSSVETLVFDEVDITSDQLATILAHAPNLKKLVLWETTITGNFQPHQNLATLEMLALDACDNANNINALLNHAPNLKELQIYNINKTTLDELKIRNIFSHLTTIIAEDIAPSSPFGMQLLTKSPHLKKLTCDWSKQCTDSIVTHQLIPELRYLRPYGDFTAHDAETLKKYAPSFSTINLYGIAKCGQTNFTVIDHVITQEKQRALYAMRDMEHPLYQPRNMSLDTSTNELTSIDHIKQVLKEYPNLYCINGIYVSENKKTDDSYLTKLLARLHGEKIATPPKQKPKRKRVKKKVKVRVRKEKHRLFQSPQQHPSHEHKRHAVYRR